DPPNPRSTIGRQILQTLVQPSGGRSSKPSFNHREADPPNPRSQVEPGNEKREYRGSASD
ncbi:hypothetical protein, partial [Microseira wollei]|uniref:hypothetical protein n=1 Tax=Microseira wollei TaxID=467598 RepID=UPI001CFE3FA0